jgi:hypothetical protein
MSTLARLIFRIRSTELAAAARRPTAMKSAVYQHLARRFGLISRTAVLKLSTAFSNASRPCSQSMRFGARLAHRHSAAGRICG